jgi:hypothetical protein
MRLPNSANALLSTLLSTQSFELVRLPHAAVDELKSAVVSLEDGEREVTAPFSVEYVAGDTGPVSRVTASARLRGDLFQRLLADNDIRKVLLDEYQRGPETEWVSRSESQQAKLETPFGLEVTLSARDT